MVGGPLHQKRLRLPKRITFYEQSMPATKTSVVAYQRVQDGKRRKAAKFTYVGVY